MANTPKGYTRKLDVINVNTKQLVTTFDLDNIDFEGVTPAKELYFKLPANDSTLGTS